MAMKSLQTFHKNPYYTTGAQKTLHLWYIPTGQPALYLQNLSLVQDPALIVAGVPNNIYLRDVKVKLVSQKGPSCVLHTMEDAINIVTVLPHKLLDPLVSWHGFTAPLRQLISPLWAKDWNIIQKWQHCIKLILQNEGYVTLKDGD